MEHFIVEHPGTVQIVLGGLLGFIFFLYKQNESKSAKLIASKLDEIVSSIGKLFARDEIHTDLLAKHESAIAIQKQRCDDREHNCPGKQACRTLSRQEDRQRFAVEKDRS